jgi:hypothetical protein
LDPMELLQIVFHPRIQTRIGNIINCP